MKKLLLILILLVYSCGSNNLITEEKINSKPISLYKTTRDYINNNPMQINPKVIIKEEGKEYIKIKYIFNNDTDFKVKKWKGFSIT